MLCPLMNPDRGEESDGIAQFHRIADPFQRIVRDVFDPLFVGVVLAALDTLLDEFLDPCGFVRPREDGVCAHVGCELLRASSRGR